MNAAPPPRIDVSGRDPVDVLLVIARYARVEAPDGAREWLAAPGPAPDGGDGADAYRGLIDALRTAELPAFARSALDDALAAASGNDRLSHLLGQANADEPARVLPAPAADATTAADPERREATAEAEATDLPRDDVGVGRDGDRNDVGDGGGGWFEAPSDDPAAVLIAAARRAGITVPDGAHAWLCHPDPAPFDQAWPYRALLTSLAVAQLPADARARVDDAMARARTGTGRLADLLGQAKPRRAQRPWRREVPLRPGPDDAAAADGDDVRRRGGVRAWLRAGSLVAVMVAAVATGVALAWAAYEILLPLVAWR